MKQYLKLRFKVKSLFLYFYALLNLYAWIKMKTKNYLKAFDIYESIRRLLEMPCEYSNPEKERKSLQRDHAIIKFNLANCAIVLYFLKN